MSDGVLHFAMREVRTTFFNIKAFVLLMGIGVIVAVMAPFGTHEIEPAFLRFSYWAVVVYSTAVAGSFVGDIVLMSLRPKLGKLFATFAAGLVASVAICAVVIGVNILIFGGLQPGTDLMAAVWTIFSIAIIIFGVLSFMDYHPHVAVEMQPPAILQRLPVEVRGTLVSLSAEDHYVRVRTLKGEHMVLMRLSDAILEAGALEGLQVHRSHWVAKAQVIGAKRDGDKAVLTMSNGHDVPVSRKYVPLLKSEGLLV